MIFIDSIRQLSGHHIRRRICTQQPLHRTLPTCACPIKRRLKDPMMGCVRQIGGVVPDYREVFAFRITEYSYYGSNKARESVEQICCVAASSDSPSRLNSIIIYRPYSNPIANKGTDHDLSSGRRNSYFMFDNPSFPTIPQLISYIQISLHRIAQ